MLWVWTHCCGPFNSVNDLNIIFGAQERETYKFTYLRKVMLSLLDSRRELLGATLTQDQTLELQLKVISKIDWGNRWVKFVLIVFQSIIPHKWQWTNSFLDKWLWLWKSLIFRGYVKVIKFGEIVEFILKAQLIQNSIFLWWVNFNEFLSL